jgi:hypothetical protein
MFINYQTTSCVLEKETHLKYFDTDKSVERLLKFVWNFTVIKKVDSDSALQTGLFDVFFCK